MPTPLEAPLDARIDGTPVLVVTRQIHSPVNGVRYFGLIALGAALAAALVAAALARRFSRPLVAAVDTTRRIASGDLDATVEVGPHEVPEFAQLAGSINVMGASLARARDQERQFLLSVSHELRTPLTSIRGYADAVLDGATDDPRAAAAVISAEARRLERLVQDLLDLARLDADRFTFELRTLDAAVVVRQVVGGFQPRAAELGIDLVLAPGSEVTCPVSADGDRLGQILANLVENASELRQPPGAGRPGRWTGRRRPVGGRRRAGHPGRPVDPGLRPSLHDGPGRWAPLRIGPGPRHRGRTGHGHGGRRARRVAHRTRPVPPAPGWSSTSADRSASRHAGRFGRWGLDRRRSRVTAGQRPRLTLN